MNEIFTVWVVANYYYEEDGQKSVCYPEEREWVDSYWTDEAAAVAEAERLWSNNHDEMYEKIVVFGRKLNMSGSGKNGIACATDGLKVGSNANFYFMLNWLGVNCILSKLYKRIFQKGIAISVNLCYNIYRN